MKIREIRITPNSDKTYQVTICGDEFGKDLSYSAKDLSEVASKIEEGQKEFAGMKSDKKKSSMKEFLGVKMGSEEDDKDED